jgi:glycine oxidase
VGAGVIGAAIAYELAAAGARVRVIDARGPARGATQASAGVLAPYIEGHASEALSTLGRRSLDLYDDFVDRIARAVERPIAYGRIGTLEVALDDEQASLLRQSAERLTRHGVDAHWLSGQDLANTEPAVAPSAVGGLLIPIHGFVGAVDLTSAMVAAASRHGVIFEHGTRALGVESAGAALHVLTDAGRWEARHVVVAAGSWSGQLAVPGATAAPVRPVRGQLLVLRQSQPTLGRIVWGRDCYLVPWPDGTVLVGATMEEVGFDERATVQGVAGLVEAARVLVPSLAEAAFEGVRVGLRPAGPDHLPLVGPSTRLPGLIYAAGHFRNGVLLAPLTAVLVKEIVGGSMSDPALALLAPARAGL